MAGGHKLLQVTFRLEAAHGSGHQGTHQGGRSAPSLPCSSRTHLPIICSSSHICGPSAPCISQAGLHLACPELCLWDGSSPDVSVTARGPGGAIPTSHAVQAAHQDARSGRGARTSCNERGEASGQLSVSDKASFDLLRRDYVSYTVPVNYAY